MNRAPTIQAEHGAHHHHDDIQWSGLVRYINKTPMQEVIDECSLNSTAKWCVVSLKTDTIKQYFTVQWWINGINN